MVLSLLLAVGGGIAILLDPVTMGGVSMIGFVAELAALVNVIAFLAAQKEEERW